MANIYREEIHREAMKEARVLAVPMAEKMSEEKIEKSKIKNSFDLALKLAKKYNRSFESILYDFEVSSEDREILIERYKNMAI